MRSHQRRAQSFDRRDDRVDFLASEMAAFAGVRIESEHGDARGGDAEAPDQIVMENSQRAHQAGLRDCARHRRQRQVGRRQRDAQVAAEAAAAGN